MTKTRERMTLAIVVAGILTASVIRSAHSDDARASAVGASRSATRPTATAAIHTATPAHPLRHHLRHAALAAHRHRRMHVTPELRAHPLAMRTASLPPAPALPARESHPRAALPVMVRPVHHPTWDGGSRLAAALPRAGTTMPVSSTTPGRETYVRASEAEREVSEARGPPRPERNAHMLHPTLAQRPSSSRARIPGFSAHSNVPAPIPPVSPPGAERACVAPATAVLAVAAPSPAPETPLAVMALPHGRADVRRMESATTCCTWLSAGGVP